MEVRYTDGLVTILNESGFTLEVMSATVSFDQFVAAARVDATGTAPDSAVVFVRGVCGGIPVYGGFLVALGFCNPETDELVAYGGAELTPWEGGVHSAPTGVGTVTFTAEATGITATVTGSTLPLDAHNVNLLLVDPVAAKPITLGYALDTVRAADTSGNLASVFVPYEAGSLPTQVRVYLMVDTYPAAVDTVTVP